MQQISARPQLWGASWEIKLWRLIAILFRITWSHASTRDKKTNLHPWQQKTFGNHLKMASSRGPQHGLSHQAKVQGTCSQRMLSTTFTQEKTWKVCQNWSYSHSGDVASSSLIFRFSKQQTRNRKRSKNAFYFTYTSRICKYQYGLAS